MSQENVEIVRVWRKRFSGETTSGPSTSTTPRSNGTRARREWLRAWRGCTEAMRGFGISGGDGFPRVEGPSIRGSRRTRRGRRSRPADSRSASAGPTQWRRDRVPTVWLGVHPSRRQGRAGALVSRPTVGPRSRRAVGVDCTHNRRTEEDLHGHSTPAHCAYGPRDHGALRPGCGGDDDDDDTAATEATTTEEAAAGGGVRHRSA